MSKLHYCTCADIIWVYLFHLGVYTCFIWVYLLHLGIHAPFLFGYTCFIWVYLCHLGIPFSFGYTCVIWVYLFHLGIYTFFIWVYLGYTCVIWVYPFHLGIYTCFIWVLNCAAVWGRGRLGRDVTTSCARAPCCDHKHPSAWYIRIIIRISHARTIYSVHACVVFTRVRVYSDGQSSGHVLGMETSMPRRAGVRLASAKLWKEVWATARKLLPK